MSPPGGTLAASFWVDGVLSGVVVVAREDRSRAFTALDILLMDGLAGQAGLALHRIEAIEERQRLGIKKTAADSSERPIRDHAHRGRRCPRPS